jgi:hypothetical protein
MLSLISRLTNALKKASIVWLTLLVWPSVSGWNAVDIRSLPPMAVRNPIQNFDVNCESRSETMSVGILCNLHIAWANTSVRFSALFFYFLCRIKSTIFVKQSIMTQSLWHLSLRGRSMMKSIAMDDNGENANSLGYNKP